MRGYESRRFFFLLRCDCRDLTFKVEARTPHFRRHGNTHPTHTAHVHDGTARKPVRKVVEPIQNPDG